MAYDIISEKNVVIPDEVNINVHETFVVNNMKYIIVYIEYPSNKIEVMPYDEYVKRNTLVKCENGEYKTQKEIENEEL